MVSLRKDMQIIFQDPMDSLNGRHTVGAILQEPFEIHQMGDAKQRRQWAEELLLKVGLPIEAMEKYPHEFSGGQKQRIGIARAIALKPKVIVCDEAVSALDVSVQAQVISLLKKLKKDLGLSYIFIAHDLPVVRDFADRVIVMKEGQIVETGLTKDIFLKPQKKYTQELLLASLEPDPDVQLARRNTRKKLPEYKI